MIVSTIPAEKVKCFELAKKGKNMRLFSGLD